ncbi:MULTISPECIES: efflux RND transporter periplasmic adaptor subunit [unclassified Pseudomonas]|uniref:efflux RND transporter periplasmic adaptor subunit n=1 Tax=unclassified Pseudomonas TaxID=196821 RepID=UPI0012966C69|nr:MULTISPECIES: efflux RND transporter periplasmic adaptor subunit [unclassified Pseudomonas]MQT42848.1 efflux RND transporter periplasmic adaptor subunit [Pseudomonas sp. FSL R10-0765]MQT54785.1 efflux RND transporter periplasmic adaptor subunit [Pseudomonas sp. FSL R10-2398]MQU02257.1 efflux RND transporter periplasmic adaptor subunit [Pseudomonas sp. FSL R10-2245]MQU11903.1 efflux RND transporter periplasmic adaptor subunit [Pseudomonas sp. FSL R10-2189]MQU38655.1 efflux RND transporter pe
MTFNKTKVTGLVVAALALGVAAGWWAGQPRDTGMAPSMAASAPKALYWYDPMFPQQKFDKPGKSPFMDMQLVAQYADDKADAQTLRVDPGQTENLGVRLATVSRGMLATRVMASGVLGFNERDVAVVQARTPGFVERVYTLAPGDVLKPDAALADVLVPEWAAAQEEFLALKRVGDSALLAAARQRLLLTGMPSALIAQVERSGKVQPVLTVTSPVGGVLQTLNVRQGMTLGLGETLAQVNGLGSVWLTVAVPEAQAAAVAPGQTVEARLPAYVGEVFKGTVSTILPQTNADSRTLQVRVELANPGARLRPGLTAQVSLEQGIDQHVLWVPSEAVIRTGHQALVMLAEEGGHYRPVEVRTGPENDGQTAILQGLQEGQHVVSSGQFLLDSEASLKGLDVTPLAPNLPTGSQP